MLNATVEMVTYRVTAVIGLDIRGRDDLDALCEAHLAAEDAIQEAYRQAVAAALDHISEESSVDLFHATWLSEDTGEGDWMQAHEAGMDAALDAAYDAMEAHSELTSAA